MLLLIGGWSGGKKKKASAATAQSRREARRSNVHPKAAQKEVFAQHAGPASLHLGRVSESGLGS